MLKNVGQVVLLSELCQKRHKEMVDYLGFNRCIYIID